LINFTFIIMPINMKRRTLIRNVALSVPALYLPKAWGANRLFSEPTGEPMMKDPFSPTWDSLQQYKTPDWFRNAKLGLWAPWGPQCQPEHGDSYDSETYMEGTDDCNFHVQKYGHPSKFGFKDVINEWKTEQWTPEELLALYKDAGQACSKSRTRGKRPTFGGKTRGNCIDHYPSGKKPDYNYAFAIRIV
jgi:alpha-L-fucosidase